MKLKPSFITHSSDSEHVTVSVDASAFSGLVRSNSTAGFIVEQLKHETSRDALVDACLATYDVDRATASAGVDKVLATLRSIDALDE